MTNVRQYIGARYVLKIYENSTDPASAEWEANTSYEPLTMVNYRNTSYISKKDVPATVGEPGSNPGYWALSGAYNGQIAELQSEISDINNIKIPALHDEIDTLGANKILFMGDSYNTIYPDEGWDMEFINAAGLSSDDYFRINIAGAGFCGTPSWNDALSNRLDLIADKEAYKAIIVCSGGNDKTYTLEQHITAMTTFKNIVNANFPNADIYIGFLGWSGIASQHTLFRNGLINYINAAEKLGFYYLHNVEYVLHWQPYLRDNQSVTAGDYFHPTREGNIELGDNILQAYKTGMCDVRYSAAITFTADGTNVTNIAGDAATVSMHNDVTTLVIGGQSMTYAAAVAVLTGKTIGSFACNCFNPDSVYSPLHYRNLSTGKVVPVNFVLSRGTLQISPYDDLEAGTQRSMPFILTLPSTSC